MCPGPSPVTYLSSILPCHLCTIIHYTPRTGPSPPGYGAEDVSVSPLRLREEDGYEQARRVRNVIEHLRRGSAAHKPLVVVVANSGVPEEVSDVGGKGEQCMWYGATSQEGEMPWVSNFPQRVVFAGEVRIFVRLALQMRLRLETYGTADTRNTGELRPTARG